MTEAMQMPPGLRLVRAANPGPLTGAGTNSWVIGEGRVAIIDPGPADPAHLAALLAAISGERVECILVTHAHADHSALARPLADATGAPVLAWGDAAAGRDPRLAALPALGGGEGVDRTFHPDQTLADGGIVEGPDWRLEVVHTPGHMANHICLAWGEETFTGDHVMGWATSIVSPPDGDMAAYMTSLDRLAGRGTGRCWPGHGAAVADGTARIAELVAHRRQREAQILAALSDRAETPAALAEQIYADLDPRLLPAAARNVLAHLIDLASRGLVSADAELRRFSSAAN
ncbi:MAG: MBL fold metallo-hydrolase [Gemmobacter sp.]